MIDTDLTHFTTAPQPLYCVDESSRHMCNGLGVSRNATHQRSNRSGQQGVPVLLIFPNYFFPMALLDYHSM